MAKVDFWRYQLATYFAHWHLSKDTPLRTQFPPQGLLKVICRSHHGMIPDGGGGHAPAGFAFAALAGAMSRRDAPHMEGALENWPDPAVPLTTDKLLLPLDTDTSSTTGAVPTPAGAPAQQGTISFVQARKVMFHWALHEYADSAMVRHVQEWATAALREYRHAAIQGARHAPACPYGATVPPDRHACGAGGPAGAAATTSLGGGPPLIGGLHELQMGPDQL